MNPRNFFAELKRRNVYKVAIAYAVVGWLMMQVAATVVPALHLPDSITTAVVVLTLLGFPIALVIAWAFEMTPEGIKRTELTANEGQRSRSRAWIHVVMIAGAVSLSLFFLGRLTAPHRPGASAEVSSKSIAVLPFENLSANQENAFFTDGVQDEILTDLAKIANLKVISRTSVMQYKAATARNLPEIAQALKVANVLEGSVQRSANRVRVSAQLIDARSDTHIWAENYDRELSDVFAIQSEIAQAIADQLQAQLSPREKATIEERPTNDLVAYDLYLKAKRLRDEYVLNQSHERENILEGIELLNQAVQRDPHFLSAICLLALGHDALYFSYDRTEKRRALAETQIEAASKLRPDAGETHLARGVHYYMGYLDYPHAREELSRAQQLLPNNSVAPGFLAYIARREGRWNDAVRDMKRAVELDPNDWLLDLADIYLNLRRYEDAIQTCDRYLVLHPGQPLTRFRRALVDFDSSANLAPARAVLNQLEKENPAARAELAEYAFDLAARERDPAAAAREVATLSRQPRENLPFPTSFCEGWVARLRKDEPAARAAFVVARAENEQLVHAQPQNSLPLAMLAFIDASMGNKEKAIAEARAACALSPLDKDALNGALMKTNLARVYALTGECDLALAELATVSKLPAGPSYGELKLGPEWDSLRGDPRFEKILTSLAPESGGTK